MKLFLLPRPGIAELFEMRGARLIDSLGRSSIAENGRFCCLGFRGHQRVNRRTGFQKTAVQIGLRAYCVVVAMLFVFNKSYNLNFAGST